MPDKLPPVQLLAFDLDGTLTDGTTWYAGADLGWVQRYSIRDGEALLRLVERGLRVAPLSRNRTDSARRRIEHLGLPTTWLGVSNKAPAFDDMLAAFGLRQGNACFIGDGREDAEILGRVGVGLAVGNAHPEACAAARRVLERCGGMHVVEEVELLLEAAGSIPALHSTGGRR